MKQSARHHGFAMVTAIFLMSLTVMAMTEIGLGIAADARRTALAAQDAQLRQLLFVGADFAVAHPAAGHYDIALPGQIAGTLSVDVLADHTVEIEAALPHRRGGERVTLGQGNGGWRVASAILEN
jgi:hypothetical protein